MTRLMREHPAIEAEVDEDGRLLAIRFLGRREPVEVCNHWRIEESWWREPIARDYFKVVGPGGSRSSIAIDSRAPGTWSGCMTDGGRPSGGRAHHQRDDEQDGEETDDQRQCPEIPWTCALHLAYPRVRRAVGNRSTDSIDVARDGCVAPRTLRSRVIGTGTRPRPGRS